MKSFLIIIIFAGLLILSGCSSSGEIPFQPEIKSGSTVEKKYYNIPGGFGYLLYLPEGYKESSQPWPLVLFLHGSGERGSNLDALKRNGPPMLVDKGKEFPFLLMSPQCPANSYWNSALLYGLLDTIQANYKVDSLRLYITGLSMGGYGTLALAQRYPSKFAAIVPIAGGGNAATVCSLRHLPVWAFHGMQDNIVPFSESEKMVKALQSCGGNVKFTAYPNAGHDSWTAAYYNEALYEWMLKCVRPSASRASRQSPN